MAAPAVADCGASSTFHVPAPPPASETTTALGLLPRRGSRSDRRTRARPDRGRRAVVGAAATLTRPAPSSVTGASCVCAVSPQAGPAVDISADLTCCGVQFGWSSTRSAAAPATCGAAMLVPSKTANCEPVELRQLDERICAARGGDVRLQLVAEAVGPAEEKLVTTPPRSVSIWRTAVSIGSAPRPPRRRRARAQVAAPSRSEIIPAGTAISTGMPLRRRRRGCSTITSPIAPASCTRARLRDEAAEAARDERDRALQ